jgi:hypothetical protein
MAAHSRLIGVPKPSGDDCVTARGKFLAGAVAKQRARHMANCVDLLISLQREIKEDSKRSVLRLLST